MDNRTTKTEPFLDDFEDGNHTGWIGSGDGAQRLFGAEGAVPSAQAEGLG